MKKWQIILASVLALIVVIIVPISVFADTTTTVAGTSAPVPTVHLAIVQPWTVRSGEQMQLTVFERLNQSPIAGAGVWVVAKENVDTFKQALQNLTKQGIASVTDQNYESALDSDAVFLGHTDANGRLTHTFNETARYWLVSLKQGYLPGYSSLAVVESLSITASPKRAAPGEEVTITVDQKGTTNPESNVNVYAVKFADAKALKEKISSLRNSMKGHMQDADWDSLVAALASSIGKTDANGQIVHQFNAGRYLLIAVKKGDLPAYTLILVTSSSATTANPAATTTTTVSG